MSDGEGSCHVLEEMNFQERLAMTQAQYLVNQYRDSRKESGVIQTDQTWLQGPLSSWISALQLGEGRVECLSPKDMALLGILIGQTLSIRDGLIISIICPRSDLEFAPLLDLCVRPHKPENITIVSSTLDLVFKNRQSRPDLDRCQVGLTILGAMSRFLCNGHRAQSLAVSAYTLWWLGRQEAQEAAAKALEDDRECSLAAIVLGLTSYGIGPAWKEYG